MIGEMKARQVLSLANEGLAAAEICEKLALSEEDVKLCLATYNAGRPEDRDITNEQLAAIRSRILDIALSSQDDAVALKACSYLLDRDRPKESNQPVNNILLINQAIQAANNDFEKLARVYGT